MCVDLWLQIGTGGPFLKCMCVCGGAGEGLPMFRLKIPFVLLHGSKEVRPGVYIVYLLIVLVRGCSSMHSKKGRKTTVLNASDESYFSIQASIAALLRTMDRE